MRPSLEGWIDAICDDSLDSGSLGLGEHDIEVRLELIMV